MELRKPVYRSVAGRCIDADHFVQMMSSVKWDVKDIMSQHSTYVDALLQVHVILVTRLYVALMVSNCFLCSSFPGRLIGSVSQASWSLGLFARLVAHKSSLNLAICFILV